MSQERDFTYPWGHWMRIEAGSHDVRLIDDDGTVWKSLRDALFYGRLGFPWVMNPGGRDPARDVELERLLAYLLLKMGDHPDRKASTSGLFDRGPDFFRFYTYWLAGTGLIAGGYNGSPYDARVTPEGRSIAAMLLATRPPEAMAYHPGLEAMATVAEDAEEISRAQFQSARKFAMGMPYLFVSEPLHRLPAISLLYKDPVSRMPIVRTIWAQTFEDVESRNLMFEWMKGRLPLWNKWGEMARTEGAAILTQRLFSLFLAELQIVLGSAPASTRARISPPA